LTRFPFSVEIPGFRFRLRIRYLRLRYFRRLCSFRDLVSNFRSFQRTKFGIWVRLNHHCHHISRHSVIFSNSIDHCGAWDYTFIHVAGFVWLPMPLPCCQSLAQDFHYTWFTYSHLSFACNVVTKHMSISVDMSILAWKYVSITSWIHFMGAHFMKHEVLKEKYFSRY